MIIGLGFLGSAIAREAVHRGLETRVLTRSKPTLKGPWNLILGDAAEPGLVRRVTEHIDHIIYAAGGAVPAEAEANPLADLAHSLTPLLNVIDACAHVGCGLTLLSSGGTVYGNAIAQLINENHPTNPIGAYGIRNLAAEKYALMKGERHGFNVRVLRIANAYGNRQRLRRSQGIVRVLLQSLMRDEPITVYGDGLVIRDYIYVADVASAAVGLLSAPAKPTIVNVGTGRGHSMLDLISVCNSVTGRQANVRFEQSRSFDVRRNVLDIGLLHRLLEFCPTPLELGIRELWDQAMARAEANLQR